MVASIVSNDDDPAFSAPAGWNLVRQVNTLPLAFVVHDGDFKGGSDVQRFEIPVRQGRLQRLRGAALHAAFDLAAQRGSPGVMIIWQDNPFEGTEPKTLAALKSRTIAFGKPVVLVHGDTHSFRIDHPWSDVDNFTRVETYATIQSDHWVLATVNPSSPGVFSFASKTAP